MSGRYETGYEVLGDVAAHGFHQDFVTIANSPEFVTRWAGAAALLGVANRWYLTPALNYLPEGRIQDAVGLATTFLRVSDIVTASGFWVSALGVDLTDIATLHREFCRSTDLLRERRCTAGLLWAIRAAVLGEVGIPKESEYRLTSAEVYAALDPGGLDLRLTYHQVPAGFVNAELAAYLDALQILAEGHAVETLHKIDGARADGSAVSALWHYLEGRAALTAARQNFGGPDCANLLRRSAQALLLSQGAGQIQELRRSVEGKLRDIQTGALGCQAG